MTTLLLSTRSLPAAAALESTAKTLGWTVAVFDENRSAKPRGKPVFYGGTDLARSIAAQWRLALLEPPLDLLARLPLQFRQRAAEFGRFADLHRLKGPTFVKPADALDKAFDAGIYTTGMRIQSTKPVPPQTPVLVAEPVQWLAECRCFMLDGAVAAWSPYLSFGRPVWKPFGQGGNLAKAPDNVRAFCARVLSQSKVAFPPAFVVDVGVIEDRGWAVVEFNPVWCSGLLGADPRAVLPVLDRACQKAAGVTKDDRRWVIERASPKV
jgi:hypothetical protein